MRTEYANKIVAFIESECKTRLENAIRYTLGVKVDLKFEVIPVYSGRSSEIICKDTLSDVDAKMRSNKILKQLFDSAELRINVWPNDEEDGLGVVFNIGVSYKHNFNGGSNGHDLMVYSYDGVTGEERILA